MTPPCRRGLRFETGGFGIAVSGVAPGPVHTGFAEEATAVPGGDGPYAGFMRGVAARNSTAYGRSDARGTLDADDVARRVLPTVLWDAALRRPYRTP